MVTEGRDAGVNTGQVLGGKYRIEELLGAGGMGAVYAATHIELEERVAIKVLLPALLDDEPTVKRFSREARAAVKIKGEHVVRVLDVGKLDSGLPYFVMELFTGVDLGDLASERTLAVEEVVDFTLQALRGLAEAHAIGIVHRDLKPANLFVTQRRDGTSCIKVLDFGISKSTIGAADPSISLTQTTTVVGSPGFMAPEQWLSAKDIDARADIWAIGAVMFQLLTGRTPFDGKTVAQLCAAVLNAAPPSIRELRSDVPEALEHVILRCLAKDRADRFRDVGELAFALEPFAPERSRISAESIAATVGSSPDVSQAASSTPSSPRGVTVPIPDRGEPEVESSAVDRTPVPARSAPESGAINLMDTSLSNVLPSKGRSKRAPAMGLIALAVIAIGGAAVMSRQFPTTTSSGELRAVDSTTAAHASPSIAPSLSTSATAETTASAPTASATTSPPDPATVRPIEPTATASPRPRHQPVVASAAIATMRATAAAASSSLPVLDRSELGGRH